LNEKSSTRSAGATTIKQRIVAVSAFLAVALIFYYFTHLPVARYMDQAVPWNTELGEELVIRPQIGPFAAPFVTPPVTPLVTPLGVGHVLPLISVEGVDNEGIDVRFESAHLDAAAVDGLRNDHNFAVARTEGPISWKTKTKGNGHTIIDIGLQAAPGIPELRIAHFGEGSHPGLSLMARNAKLIVQLSVLLGDDKPGAAAEQKILRIGEEEAITLPPGMLPITVVVPEGRRFTLTFPVANPTSYFRFGGAAERGLLLRDLGVQRPDMRYKQYACAAQPLAHFFYPRTIRTQDCASAATLRAFDFKLSPNNMAVFLAGSAFVVQDGNAQTDDWLAKLERNKPLAVLFGMVFAGLGNWVWRAFSRGKDDGGK
jgi:hypothetical protein